jgi:hypothetical protein
MQLFRGLAGVVLGIVSAVLGLLAVILCVTVILLPLGLPLLGYAGRLFMMSFKLVLPRAASHPAQEAAKSIRGGGRKAKKKLGAAQPKLEQVTERGRHTARRLRKRVPIAS